MSNFAKVEELVSSGKLKILSILSPSRTVSTVFSKSVSVHPDVSAEILQPFHLNHIVSSTEEREEEAYGRILAAYNEAAAKSPEGKPVVILVAKEMARNLTDPKALERWDNLCQNHIITIRNPLLALESTLRLNLNFLEERPKGVKKMAEEFAQQNGIEPTDEYFQNFCNVYAKYLGFKDPSGLGQHWKKLAEHARTQRNYKMLAPLLEEFLPFDDLNAKIDEVRLGYLDALTDKTARQAGYANLTSFASKLGCKSWNDALRRVHEKAISLDAFAPLLDKVFLTSNTGWQGLNNLLRYFKDSARIHIIDGSVLRAHPGVTAAATCEYLGLDAHKANSMVNWGDIQKVSPLDHLTGTYKAVYARAHASQKLEPPLETPIPPSRFPEQFQKHFTDVAMPLYIRALGDDRCIRPRGKEELKSVLDEKTPDGHVLYDVDPVWAYSLISTDKKLSPQDKTSMLQVLRDKHDPVWNEVFDLIDRIRHDALKEKFAPYHEQKYASL